MERAALGKRIRESRIKKEYTQQYLASKADIGVVYLSEIERGVKMPSLNIFIKIIDALDVSADYIVKFVSAKHLINLSISIHVFTIKQNSLQEILHGKIGNHRA